MVMMPLPKSSAVGYVLAGAAENAHAMTLRITTTKKMFRRKRLLMRS